MPFTDEQIAHIREFGYVARPDFLTRRETAALQTEVARFQREGLLRNVHTDWPSTSYAPITRHPR